MSRPGGLIAWQWATYDRNHRDRLNLALHFLAVPAFIAGVLSALRLLTLGLVAQAAIMLGVAVVAFLLQGVGHRREREAPIPFEGPLDAIGRIVVEQFITFPRFVFTGGWARNLAGQHTDQH